MSCKIVPSREFLRKAKPLSKKFPSFKSDLRILTDSLLETPRQGTEVRPDVYKIRLAIKSKGKGKSGGARVITLVETRVFKRNETTIVRLVTIYDKSEVSAVREDYLEQTIAEIRQAAEEE